MISGKKAKTRWQRREKRRLMMIIGLASRVILPFKFIVIPVLPYDTGETARRR